MNGDKRVRAFYEQLETDKDLRAKLGAVLEQHPADQETARVKLIEIAADAGYDFTREEYDAEMRKKGSGEPEEVITLAGGGIVDPIGCAPEWKIG